MHFLLSSSETLRISTFQEHIELVYSCNYLFIIRMIIGGLPVYHVIKDTKISGLIVIRNEIIDFEIRGNELGMF